MFGFKPWDSGVPPPELVTFVETNRAGKSLDLGCGTGTNTIYLAQKGWDATGVDFVPRAIGAARKKAAAARVSPRLIVGDVTRLPELGIGDGYNLLLDLGCFHSIPDGGRDDYVKGASAVAPSGATMLLFGFTRRDRSTPLGPRGLARDEVRDRFTNGWELVREVGGRPIAGYDAAWYTLLRR
ncbi:MAG TPA: class I SAM-dependent methyltransferase [Candidatus Dormibacteraeota bacterium]|nr:class I SAM-dependent methyltransferase [Candidatus Dormibacteraeota bacterium]